MNFNTLIKRRVLRFEVAVINMNLEPRGGIQMIRIHARKSYFSKRIVPN